MKNFLRLILAILVFFCGIFPSLYIRAAVATIETRTIFFPTETTVTFSDDFGDARSGHLHEANDLMGKKMTPLYSAIDGRVHNTVVPEASYGYAITLEDVDGYTYHYLHVNNDTPGTDDGLGGVEHAYAPGIVRGALVTKGQLIGWMGDSGNAENVGSHLHFEIRLPDGTAIDPYLSLMAARYIGSYSISAALATSPNINIDKGLVPGFGAAPCVSGSLIKISTVSAVYYCGADGKRHAFTNDRAYFTWYKNFTGILTLKPDQLATVPLGSNVTYRPGVKLVKIQTDPKIYALEKNGVLRWVRSEETAATLYGSDWNKKVDEISDAFFTDYTVGDPVLSAQTQ